MLKHFLLVSAFIGACVAGAPAEEVPRPSLEERVIVVGDRSTVPCELKYSTDLTAVKAIIRSGGYGDFSRTPVYLVRAGVVTRLDTRAIERGETDKDVALKPWDIIVIGYRVSQRP